MSYGKNTYDEDLGKLENILFEVLQRSSFAHENYPKLVSQLRSVMKERLSNTHDTN